MIHTAVTADHTTFVEHYNQVRPQQIDTATQMGVDWIDAKHE